VPLPAHVRAAADLAHAADRLLFQCAGFEAAEIHRADLLGKLLRGQPPGAGDPLGHVRAARQAGEQTDLRPAERPRGERPFQTWMDAERLADLREAAGRARGHAEALHRVAREARGTNDLPRAGGDQACRDQGDNRPQRRSFADQRDKRPVERLQSLGLRDVADVRERGPVYRFSDREHATLRRNRGEAAHV
jgi:hypothetical protein